MIRHLIKRSFLRSLYFFYNLPIIRLQLWPMLGRAISVEDVRLFNIRNRWRVRQLLTKEPQTIQEKLMWLNIYDVPWSDKHGKPLKTICADKLLVKEYAKEKLGVDIGVKTLRVYNQAKDINWEELPNRFIVKVNHNSGGTIICRDKSQLDIRDCVKKLDKWIKEDFTFRNGFESHYHWMDRKILVEELLSDDNQEESLIDYKFWCFNGSPAFFTINSGHGHGAINHYDLRGKLLGFSRTDYPRDTERTWSMPANLDTMIEYSKRLSADFKFVRVDFYEIRGKVYLGEMTFAPGACDFHYEDNNDSFMVGQLLSVS